MAGDFDSPWPGIATAGNLALSFVNTLDWRLREPPVELLEGFPELLRWAWTVDALDRPGAHRLRAWGEVHPRLASDAWARAIEVREAIAAAFTAVQHEVPVPDAALAVVEGACLQAWSARALRADGGEPRWAWREGEPEPDRPAWSAALEAARLLTSDERHRVRQCGDAQCGWMFLDTSRNRSRRWCSMEGCGNRNKARRFYRRASAKHEAGRREG